MRGMDVKIENNTVIDCRGGDLPPVEVDCFAQVVVLGNWVVDSPPSGCAQFPSQQADESRYDKRPTTS